MYTFSKLNKKCRDYLLIPITYVFISSSTFVWRDSRFFVPVNSFTILSHFVFSLSFMFCFTSSIHMNYQLATRRNFCFKVLRNTIIKNYEMIHGAQLSNSFILLMALNEAKDLNTKKPKSQNLGLWVSEKRGRLSNF